MLLNGLLSISKCEKKSGIKAPSTKTSSSYGFILYFASINRIKKKKKRITNTCQLQLANRKRLITWKTHKPPDVTKMHTIFSVRKKPFSRSSFDLNMSLKPILGLWLNCFCPLSSSIYHHHHWSAPNFKESHLKLQTKLLLWCLFVTCQAPTLAT